MANQTYSASLSRTQGRSGYSIIFRHPVRLDPATGKSGVRVRRGLGTRDSVEAEPLRDQLNELLSDTKYHQPSARTEAERRFDPRIVDIFFDNMVPEPTDFEVLREAMIRLPSSEPDGYRRVLLLGTTGAGKTTLVRQLIGTDPEEERFPSTSTAKTTIHDTEVVICDGAWRAVVTFVGIDEVREHLSECISAAVLTAARDSDDAEILRRLLNHVDQRFRFNYVLGNGPKVSKSDHIPDFDDDEPDEEGRLLFENGLGDVDLAATNEILNMTFGKLRELAHKHRDHVRQIVDAQEEKDKRVADEIFEEELDNLLRDDEDFHKVVDVLMDQIANRFETLPQGKVRKTRQGWPLSWSGEWPVENRAEFLAAISRFSSNYAPLFGRLLTPLVNGVRVAGPFVPEWNTDQAPKLVLLDGEGLGHTPTSSSAVSTSVSRKIDSSDAVLLVDNATQPMQAAPVAAMHEVVATGNARKLILAFTHFDKVKGDNLPNASAKAQHVLASAENVLAAFGVKLGSSGERALRQRLENARFFLGGLQEPLASNDKEGKRTIDQLHKLLAAIDKVIERPQPADARPVYDRLNLGFAIQEATEEFHAAWRSLLGLESGALPKEHWTRIKALNRRLAEGMADEYGTLRPIADLRKELRDRIYVFIQNPLEWNSADRTKKEQVPTEEEKRNIYDAFADEMSLKLLELSTRRLRDEFISEWQDAYRERGPGSTFLRARIIGDQIYRPAAPVPDATPSPDHNQFLREVIDMVEAAARKVCAEFR